MAEKNLKKIGTIVYSVMGMIAIFLGVVDISANAYLESILPFSCGVLFVFIRYKKRLELNFGSKRIKNINLLLVTIVIVATVIELVCRLNRA